MLKKLTVAVGVLLAVFAIGCGSDKGPSASDNGKNDATAVATKAVATKSPATIAPSSHTTSLPRGQLMLAVPRVASRAARIIARPKPEPT